MRLFDEFPVCVYNEQYDNNGKHLFRSLIKSSIVTSNIIYQLDSKKKLLLLVYVKTMVILYWLLCSSHTKPLNSNKSSQLLFFFFFSKKKMIITHILESDTLLTFAQVCSFSSVFAR